MRTRTKTLTFLLVFLGLTSCAQFQFVADTDPATTGDGPWMYDTILFEIAPVGTLCNPSEDALQKFRIRLHENRICRRDRVTFITHQQPTPGTPNIWNYNTIHVFESYHRAILDLRPGDRNLVVFVSYVMGPYLEGTRLRSLGGLQYGATSFAIFKDGARNREASVLLHEFGHLIGLVKNKDRDNHDDGHTNHCANKRCAMFWTAPGINADFDYYCKNYIRQRVLERSRK